MQIGRATLGARLIVDGLRVCGLDLAKKYAAGNRMELADAIAALGLVHEGDTR